jgi:hypothetical protein
MCGVFDSCGGGGTDANIWLRPTFKVKRRGVQETAALGSQDTTGRRRSVVNVPLAPQWANVTVLGTFQDQNERYQRQVTVTRGVPIADSELWKAEVLNDQLRIETR